LTVKFQSSEETQENKIKFIRQQLPLMEMDKHTLGVATSLGSLVMEIKEIENCHRRFCL
jgi:hypothetical protein